MKEILEHLWEMVYVDYRNYKLKLIDKWDYVRVIADASKTLGQEEEYKKYQELVEEYKNTMDELDTKIKESVKHKGDIFTWIQAEFVNAVIRETNIEKDRKLCRNDKLHEEEYKKDLIMTYIFNELMKNGNEDDLESNIEMVQINDKVEYRVKGIPLFVDYIEKDVSRTLYHGTSLENAKSIVGMNKLLCRGMTNTKNNFHNKNKIFFAESLEDSKKYAERQNTDIDDINIIFEIDVARLKLHKREHLIVEREGDLYFLHQNELDLTNRISKLYMVQGDNIQQITREDILNLSSDVMNTEDIEEIKTLQRLVHDNEKILIDMRKKSRDKILFFAEQNNITPREVCKNFGSSEKFYNEVFEIEKPKKIFYTIKEHFKYLSDKGFYNIEENDGIYIVTDGTKKMEDEKIIYPIKDKDIDFNFFHGTSISNAQKIIKTGIIKANRTEVDTIQYNKIFFSPLVEYVKYYGRIGGSSFLTQELEKMKEYIIFECNLKQYNIYNYLTDREYIIWGDASTNIITNIYLCKGDTIIKEISKEELLDIGV